VGEKRNGPAAKRHEIFGVSLLMLSVLVFGCLISYNPRDSSFNGLFYKMTADNRVGRMGAYASDLLFQIFGIAAFLLLAPMLILSWKLIRGRSISSPSMRTLGFCLLVCAACATLQLASVPVPEGSFHPGGMIGAVITGLLVPNLNTTGAVIVIAGAFVVGLLAATSFSFASIFDREPREEKPPRPGILERFRSWRQNHKPVRAVVSINPPISKTPEPSHRPAPIKPIPVPQAPRPPAVVPPREHEQVPARIASGEKPARSAQKFALPPIDLLAPSEGHFSVNEAELLERARQLEAKCAEFDVNGSITQIHPGPVVTTFEFRPDAGVKYSRITSLVDDCASASRRNPSASTGFPARRRWASKSRMPSGRSSCSAS